MGMVTPFIVWFSQKNRSSLLKFQSLQAAIYQLVTTVAYMISYACFFFMYLIFIAIIVMGEVSPKPHQEISPVVGVAFILIIAVFMLMWLAWMVLYPVYFILAGIATIRTMRGHDFKYPILGKILLKRLVPSNDGKIIQA
jgi:uncharacterized Tic20 family protein